MNNCLILLGESRSLKKTLLIQILEKLFVLLVSHYQKLEQYGGHRIQAFFVERIRRVHLETQKEEFMRYGKIWKETMVLGDKYPPDLLEELIVKTFRSRIFESLNRIDNAKSQYGSPMKNTIGHAYSPQEHGSNGKNTGSN